MKLPLLILAAFWSFQANALDLTSYLGRYNVGVDYTHSWDGMTLSYETNTSAGGPPEGCLATPSNTARMRCDTAMTAGGSSGFGLFLQQPFQRQGTFYFNWDLGFALRALSGSLEESDAQKLADLGLPLRETSFSLVGFVMRPYVQIGITPASTWPDLLLTVGPVVQLTAGHARINDEKANVFMGTSSGVTGFMELEIVVKRFGEGAFSLFSSRDFSGDERGSLFFPRSVDGMDDFRVRFSRSIGGAALGFGLKLLLDFP